VPTWYSEMSPSSRNNFQCAGPAPGNRAVGA